MNLSTLKAKLKMFLIPQSHKILYIVYVLVWIVLAIDPVYREDWFLENILVFLFFPLLIFLDRKYQLSFMAIFLFLIFAICHGVGAHFTYAEMKYFDFITDFFGFSRNHYDRVVHFLSGLLLFKFFLEIIYHHVKRYKASIVFTFCVIVSIAAVYEIVEWWAAALFHPELGASFLGAQGDIWDAQKDILVAILGALIAGSILWRKHETK